jgi:argininosuccinate synthase
LKAIEERAYELGSAKHANLIVDIIRQGYKYMERLKKNNTYPLSVSAERVFQAIEAIKYAKSVGASAIAHGSTGAGNDQIRFDLIFQLSLPKSKSLLPLET